MLGRLWNCTDVAPSDMRGDAVDWLESVHQGDPEEAKALGAGCSYAQLVRRLKPALRSALETDAAVEEAVSSCQCGSYR